MPSVEKTIPPSLAAVIVGAGFGGVGMAIKLLEAGVTDFVVLEQSGAIGGTWRDNSYPGCACDVPSLLYSFSFEQDFDWPRFYSGQRDILRYLRHCADKYGLRPYIHLNAGVRNASFEEAQGLWRVETEQGELFFARAFITATGQLNRPAYPDIPGLAAFRGKSFHSSRWDHSHDFAGRRVGVIGTGASAIQLLAPVAERAGHVTLFQRSAAYVEPKPDHEITGAQRWLFRRAPFLRSFARGSIYAIHESLVIGLVKWRPALAPLKALWSAHLRLTVKDPVLRAKLTPDYPFGCKRILFDNTFYPATTRPNVEVVTEKIAEIDESGVKTADGVRHELDTLVFATGFRASGFIAPIEVIGRGGRRLAEAWRDGAEAYLGVTVNGFPNLFMLYGPGANLGHNSIVYMLESQIRYVKQAVIELRAAPAISFEVKRDVQSRFNAKLQAALRNSVWAAGCRNWYTDATGKIANNWSDFTFTYRKLTRHFDLAAYDILDKGGNSTGARPDATASAQETAVASSRI